MPVLIRNPSCTPSSSSLAKDMKCSRPHASIYLTFLLALALDVGALCSRSTYPEEALHTA
jgi:hypothetical protein